MATQEQPYVYTYQYTLPQLEPQPIYAIPIEEWDFLEKKIGKLIFGINLFYSIGFSLLGIAGSSIATAIIGDFTEASQRRICIEIGILTAAIGAVLIIFGNKKRSISKERADDVLEHMKLVKGRFMRFNKRTLGVSQNKSNSVENEQVK